MSIDDALYADSRLIRWLLYESGVRRRQIANAVDISEATVSRMVSERIKIESIRFGSAHKLTAYARKIQAEQAAKQRLELLEPKGVTKHGEKTK